VARPAGTTIIRGTPTTTALSAAEHAALAHLDDTNVLRLWRSWTGHQIYHAVLDRQATHRWGIRDLAVEQEPDRYRGSLFRAGHTPYGRPRMRNLCPSPWP
jgi:hypothetical protein